MDPSINDRFFGVCHFSDSGTRREKRVESEINKNVQTASHRESYKTMTAGCYIEVLQIQVNVLVILIYF